MSNNRAFTSDFVSGLLSQRNTDAIEASRVKRMRSAILRRTQIVNAMSHIRMYVSPWFMDADGLMTRHAYQMPRKPTAVAVDSFSESSGGVMADQTQNEPVDG